MNITFGKYSGHTVAEVGASYEGYRYLTWLLSSDAKRRASGEKQEFDNSELMTAITAFMANNPKPDRPVLTWEDKIAHVLRIGKYKGQTLGQLITSWEGRSYLTYVASTWVEYDDLDTLKAVVDQFPLMPPPPPPVLDVATATNRKMPFGKYKGELIREMCAQRKARSYLKWLLTHRLERADDLALRNEIDYCMTNFFIPKQ